eukprot:scpid40282/ scgid19649/ 
MLILPGSRLATRQWQLMLGMLVFTMLHRELLVTTSACKCDQSKHSFAMAWESHQDHHMGPLVFPDCGNDCAPTCERLAENATSCRDFKAPGPPVLDTKGSIRFEVAKPLSRPSSFTISWCCTERHSSSVAGFRVKIIDTNTSTTLDVYDVPNRFECGRFHLRPGASISSCYCGSNCFECVTSRALTTRSNGLFYIKPNSKWNVTIQVLSLPLADNTTDSLDSDQGALQHIQVDSCRDLGCNVTDIADPDGPCDGQSPATLTQVCFCVPIKPCIFPLDVDVNDTDLSLSWTTQDPHISATFFNVLVRSGNATGNSTHLASDLQLPRTSGRLLCDTGSAPTSPTYFQLLGSSISQVQAGDLIAVTITPVVTNQYGNYSGEAAHLEYRISSAEAPTLNNNDVSLEEEADDGPKLSVTGTITISIMALSVITLGLVLCLVRRRYQERQRDQAKMPISVLQREKQQITDTVSNFELIRECFIQTGVTPVMSKEYELLYESADGSQILLNLIKIVQKKGNSAFGVLLFSLRNEGYEHLFKQIYDGVADDVQKTVDSIVYPPIPPKIRLDHLSLEDEQDQDAPSVYISYSRYVTTGMSQDRDASFKRTSSPADDVTYLCQMLQAHGVDVVIDREHLNDLADNEPQWITEQFCRAQFVIVVLDNAYPLNLTLQAQQAVMYSLDDNGYRRACQESRLLQGESYSGRHGFLLPVQFGAVTSSPLHDVPILLRNKTRYRLPHRFAFSNNDFQLLVCRILGRELYAEVNGYYQRAENHQLLYPSIPNDYAGVDRSVFQAH